MDELTFKRLLGARILSEANDLKRTPEHVASELGITAFRLEKILRGECKLKELYDLIDQLAQAYPVDASDLRLLQDDCTNGTLIMRASASGKSSRYSKRADGEGGISTYYEYRDTAFSRLSPFRPEWIRPLRRVAHPTADSKDVAFNRGHLLNQYTFYIGAITFHWMTGTQKYARAMTTGDSSYGTPWWPHSFTTRDPKRRGYILAVTFGGDARRAQRELYLLGERSKGYVVDYRQYRRALIQLLDYHLATEILSRREFLRLCGSMRPNFKRWTLFDEQKPISLEQLRIAARVLNVDCSDLLMPRYHKSDEVVIRHRREVECFYYPNASEGRYRVWPLARIKRLPLMKGFALEIMSRDSSLEAALCSGLHSWIYNYGSEPVIVRWNCGEDGDQRTVLEQHDSMYIQPFVRYAYGIRGSRVGELCEVRVPGSVGLAAQRELSYMSQIDRVFKEDGVWF